MVSAAGEMIGHLVTRVQRALRRAVDDAMAPEAMTMARYACLAALEESPGLSGAELARRASVTPQAMSRMLNDLQRDGLVRPHDAPSRGRAVGLALTDAGAQVARACHAHIAAVHARMLRDVGVEEEAVLRRVLLRCVRNLESGDGAPSRR